MFKEWMTQAHAWAEQIVVRIEKAVVAIEGFLDRLEKAPTPSDLPPREMGEPVWIDLAEASRLSSLSRSKLYAMINANELKSILVGRKRLVARSAIDALGERADPSRDG